MRSVTFAGDHAITQAFGINPDAYARFGLAGHNGVDWALPTGTDLYAPEDGTIVEAYHDVGGYGLTTYLSATSGRGWRHGHLLRLDVQVGDQVRKGQRIGTSNNTGNSSGPHLHLGMRPPNPDRNNGFGGYIDPLPTLQQLQEEPVPTQAEQLILDAASRQGLSPADIDNLNGLKKQLEVDNAGLSYNLLLAQQERDAQAAEAERLRQVLAVGSEEDDPLERASLLVRVHRKSGAIVTLPAGFEAH